MKNGYLVIKDAGWNGAIAAGQNQGYTARISFTTSDSSVLY